MQRRYINSVYLNSKIDPESYMSRLPAVKHLVNAPLLFTSDITFFVGENGTGKSTLLEAIAIAYGFNPEGGSKNFNFHTEESHSNLYEHITISRSKYAKDGFFLRAESFYNVATNIDDMDREPAASAPIIESYGGVSLHRQSHGESFLSLIKNRFGGKGVYILDEPEAALSPSGLLTLIACIGNLLKMDSQFIIATHSPMLMTFPGAVIYQFTESGIESVSYRETQHYQLSKRFLDNPEKMLKDLL